MASAGSADGPEIADLVDAEDAEPRWVFEPVNAVLSLSDARQWFWLSGLAVAVGLVICGSGGPSIVCCFFFQGPSLLSLLGFPMRYGRAGTTTRVLYAGVGIALIAWAYQKMIVEGQFGHVDGDVGLAALGFLGGSVGSAALLGSITSLVAERLNLSLEPKKTKRRPEPKISLSQACSLEPTAADLATAYLDPCLASASDGSIAPSMQPIAETLGAIGFDEPKPVAWQLGEQQKPALIQLGCQEMVVADAEEIDGEVMMRLVSVLHDGIAIVTLSPNFPTQKPLRFGSNGLFSVCDSDDPMEMLSSHLEQTVSMAEKRDTSVVNVESDEVTDVVLFAHRVLADVRAQYGEENVEVGDCRYGRFHVPAAPVAQQVAV